MTGKDKPTMKFRKIDMYIMFCLASFVLLVGCGTNLFSGLASETTGSTLSQIESKLKAASAKTDYDAIITLAQSIIDGTSASAADIQKARLFKGEAIMGQSGVTATDIVSSITSIGTSAGGTSVFNSLDNIVKDATVEALTTASVEFNRAASANTGVTLNESQLILQGFSNLLASVKRMTGEYAATNNLVTLTSGTDTASSIRDIVKPTDNFQSPPIRNAEIGSPGLYDRADASFVASGAFSSSQLQIIRTLKPINDKLVSANNAIENASTLTLDGTNYSPTDNAELLNYLKAVYGF